MRINEPGLIMRIKSLLFLVFTLVGNASGGDAGRFLAAVGAGRLDQVHDMVAQGVDVNAKNTVGRPAIVLAAFNGNERTLRALLAAGADVNAADSAGTTALMVAASFGHWQVVDALVATGADVNLTDGAGRSALANAVRSGHDQVADLLRNAGATEDDAASATKED